MPRLSASRRAERLRNQCGASVQVGAIYQCDKPQGHAGKHVVTVLDGLTIKWSSKPVAAYRRKGEK